MQRVALADLEEWFKKGPRMPLLVRGARQVGKTTLIRLFAKAHFKNLIEINFELMPEFKGCFNSLEPKDILTALNFVTKKTITPGATLLFLDEIQECPQAIMALRYFKENMPNLHVIAAGSLLEFTLNKPDFRMPVGRVQSLYIKPLSFFEYLQATEPVENIAYLEQLEVHSPIPEIIHNNLLASLKKYLILGGMPAVIDSFIQSEDFNMAEKLQAGLLQNYQNDFGKYAVKVNLNLLQNIFKKLPGMATQHFKYKNLNEEAQSREIKPVLQALYDAGLAYPIHACHASGLPLIIGKHEKKFKLLFLDVGLMQHALSIRADVYMHEDMMQINQGQIVEQFVGQELLAYEPRYEPSELFYWDRDVPGSQAEVDYLTTYRGRILPIEVKSGKTGRLKSIHVFLKEKNTRYGLKISSAPLSIEKEILSIPLYLIWKLPVFLQQLENER